MFITFSQVRHCYRNKNRVLKSTGLTCIFIFYDALSVKRTRKCNIEHNLHHMYYITVYTLQTEIRHDGGNVARDRPRPPSTGRLRPHCNRHPDVQTCSRLFEIFRSADAFPFLHSVLRGGANLSYFDFH